MIEDLHQLKEDLEEEGILFCFCGPISQKIIIGIGDTLKQKMKLEDASPTTSLKVFSTLVEQMQNVVNYSSERVPMPEEELEQAPDLGLGVVIIGRQDRKFYVLCGNQIDSKTAVRLEEKLSIIQGMDKQELKAYYKEQRKKQSDEVSKGAGLGFIEMARKATEPIKYKIKQLEGDNLFFSVKITI